MQGQWIVDVEREGRAMANFVWGLRPSFLRWPFLVALSLVAALLAALVIATGLEFGWVLLGILTALFLTVTILRLVLVRSLRASLTPRVPHGSLVEVTLDESTWRSTAACQSHAFPWADYDRVTVSDGYLILTAAWKNKWIPRSLIYAPVTAFDTNATAAIEFVSSRLRHH